MEEGLVQFKDASSKNPNIPREIVQANLKPWRLAHKWKRSDTTQQKIPYMSKEEQEARVPEAFVLMQNVNMCWPYLREIFWIKTKDDELCAYQRSDGLSRVQKYFGKTLDELNASDVVEDTRTGVKYVVLENSKKYLKVLERVE